MYLQQLKTCMSIQDIIVLASVLVLISAFLIHTVLEGREVNRLKEKQ